MSCGWCLSFHLRATRHVALAAHAESTSTYQYCQYYHYIPSLVSRSQVQASVEKRHLNSGHWRLTMDYIDYI